MKKQFIILLLPALLLTFCGPGPQQEEQTVTDHEQMLSENERAFLNNLASLCGNSFRGQETYMQEGRESWADRDMVMHVTICEDDYVHIPFHMDEDRSRTWMFINEDGRLRFRHDHRYEDGTPEELTMYGGYSDGTGNAFRQHFPADEYTIDLLVDTLNREWHVVLDEDLSNFSYRLLYHGEIVFQADFDLTAPL
ncbi:MAG: hypothetical protein EA393_02990 [Bacteroidetes bacterium]|nr:MAG: hypothetical protein EA393_02990 [Bacteroidota bacterium]